MDDQESVFLSQIIECIVSNLRRMDREGQFSLPAGAIRVKEAVLSLSYHDPSGKPLPEILHVKEDPWSYRDLQSVLSKNDRRITVNYERVARKSRGEISKLRLAIRI